MRTLEYSLIFLTALMLLRVIWPLSNKIGGSLLPSLFSFALLALHLLTEKAHWQMFPAYFITISLAFVYLLHWRAEPVENSSFWRVINSLGRLLVLFLGGALLIASVLLAGVAPIFKLPMPTGPYQIGTQDLHLIDASRPELFTSELDDPRELMVRVWYPAEVQENSRLQSFWPEIDQVGPRILALMEQPTFLAGHMKLVKTHAYINAPLLEQSPSYPVLIFSHGYGMAHFGSNQTQMEELASHGYIVFSLNHTHEALATVFPDGRVVTVDPEAFVLRSYAHLDDSLSIWDGDTRFLLDELGRINAGEHLPDFAERLDMERMGIFGMSFGGATAMDICASDSRCKAGANMDGSQFGYHDFITEPLNIPFLFFYNEHSEGMNDHIYNSAKNYAYRVTIQGTTHSNFTDVILWSPYMEDLGEKYLSRSFGPIPPEQMIRIENAYLLAFFDKHLKGETQPLLEDLSPVFPEVNFQFREP